MSVQYIPTTLNRRSADSNVHMESNYNENSTTQCAAGSALTRWLAKYTQAVSKHQGMLSITEYGCATGGSSVSPLKTIFDHAPGSVSFTVTMNDLPFNDWRVLEDTVKPIFPFVNFLYSKHSMYKGTVAPEGSVHVGFSCLAQHWLSAKPKAHFPPEYIWANQMPRNHPTRALFKKASEDDWSMFLQLRACEFARGGVLVLAIQASGADGSLNEPSAKTCAQAKEELFREGILSEKDAAGMVMPEYMKSPCEIMKPLEASDDWHVEEMKFTSLDDHPDRVDWEAGEITDKEYVRVIVGEHQAFMNPSFFLGPKKRALFWNRVRALAMKDATRLHTNTCIVYLVLQRI